VANAPGLEKPLVANGSWGKVPRPVWQPVFVFKRPKLGTDTPQRRRHDAIRLVKQHLEELAAVDTDADEAVAAIVKDTCDVQAWEDGAAEDASTWLRVARAHAAALAAGAGNRADLMQDVDAVGDALHQAEADAISADRKSWSEWVDSAFDHGGGAAHRFLQDPRDWQPDEIRLADGVVAGSPLDALTCEAATWWALAG
jgi:hypothetical protein